MIHLVRHGEAAAGWGDHPDPGLSELGHSQAAQVAVTLKDAGVTSAITSPMQRCRETCAAFEDVAGISAAVEPVVSEIATPEAVDDRVSWLRTIMAGDWQQAGDDLLGWRQQLVSTVSALPAHTAVFTHFVAINAIVAALENDPRVMVFRPTHCSVTTLAKVDSQLVVRSRGGEAVTEVL